MKILYVTTISNTLNRFLIPHIKELIEGGHQVDVAFNIVENVNKELIDLNCKIYNIKFSRNPLSKDNIHAYKDIKKIINAENYDVIHTHTPVASTCVRLACKNKKKIKVIYTAHGFHFFKGAPLKNWILYFPIEKYLSKYTDILITINQEDYQRARKSLQTKKNIYIPGVGLNIKAIQEQKVNKTRLRNDLGIPNEAFIVLSVGELNENKNHETILRAIAELKNKNIYYVICGIGPLEKHLKEKAKEIGVKDQIKLLGFREDVIKLCKIADLFAFPSKREGLGLAALEAMAVGLPIITSNVHGIVDYSINGETGYNYPPNDVEGFSTAIEYLFENPNLIKQMGKNNIEQVKKYDLENVKNEMNKIYNSIN